MITLTGNIDLRSTSESTRRLLGHTDFVKCLVATSLGGKHFLISVGADATIIGWDIISGDLLHKLKGHTKSLQDLAVDPLSVPEASSGLQDSLILYSASSDREIRTWSIGSPSAHELPASIVQGNDGQEVLITIKLWIDLEQNSSNRIQNQAAIFDLYWIVTASNRFSSPMRKSSAQTGQKMAGSLEGEGSINSHVSELAES